MQPISDFMRSDHDRLEAVLADSRKHRDDDLERSRALFDQFRAGLERHIVWEEDILFPIFEDKTGMREGGPTSVMRSEHVQIKGFLEDMHRKLAAGEIGAVADVEESLLEVLRSHNGKEENVLYPAIDNLVSGPESDRILTTMKGSSSA